MTVTKEMEKYTIEMKYKGEEIESFPMSIELNVENIEDLITICYIISSELSELEFTFDEFEEDDVFVKAFSKTSDNVLFASMKEFKKFQRNNKIEFRLTSNFSFRPYVNGEPYFG